MGSQHLYSAILQVIAITITKMAFVTHNLTISQVIAFAIAVCERAVTLRPSYTQAKNDQAHDINIFTQRHALMYPQNRCQI